MSPILSTLRPLSAGDVIIGDQFGVKPIVHMVYNRYKGKHCDNCLNISTSFDICLDCQQMYYCDQKCQINDWKYHKNECKILATKQFEANYVDWTERLLIRLWVCLQSDPTFGVRNHRLIDGSEVCLNDIEVKIKENKKNNKWIPSEYIIDYKFEFNLICRHFEEYGLKYDRKELFEWYGVISSSPISYSFRWYDMFIGTDEDSYPAFIGHGLYPELWRVTHSCLPNSAVVTNGLLLQLRAMSSIGVGSQITRSYVRLNQCQSNRQKDLMKSYFFYCDCDKCKHNLDFNINYENYETLVDMLDKDFDLKEFYYNPKVEEWLDFRKVTNKVIEMEKSIFKDIYHPSLTASLLREMIVIRWWGRLNHNTLYYIPWDSQTEYERIRRHVRITYGIHHPIYRKYFRERVSYL